MQLIFRPLLAINCGILDNLPNGSNLCQNGITLDSVINLLAGYLVTLIGLILAVVILYCAVEIVTSGGSQDRIKSAKNRLTQAAISLGLLISFRAIIAVFGIDGGNTGAGAPTLFNGVDEFTLEGVEKLIANAAQILMMAVGAFSVIFIVVGAVQYITSAGNEQGVANAKRTITYAVSGLILALSTVAIITFINTQFF